MARVESARERLISSQRVGVVFWRPDDGIGSAILASVESMGCEAVRFLYDSPLPAGLDVVLAYGPFNSLTPLTQQLLAHRPEARPSFILWMSEQLSNPAVPDWLLRPAAHAQSWLDRQVYRRTDSGVWKPNLRWQKLTHRAHRLRYYGDLLWLQRQGILTVLGVGSQWITQFLGQRGLNPVTAYFGSVPEWWADMKLERDIPVLWLGKTATDRRQKMLARLRADLRVRGVEIMVVDGIEHPYAFGEDRTILLNRSRIVVNILRTRWDNHSVRFFLSTPNRALVVTEPTLPHTPFLPGKHVVESPIEEMAQTICYHLDNPEEGAPLIERAFQLATEELTMARSVSLLLQQVL